MRTALEFTIATILLSLAMAGCISDPGAKAPDPSDDKQSVGSMETPVEAGAWNGTTLTMEELDIEETTVFYAHFSSPTNQKCESEYTTEGNVTEPSAYGWHATIRSSRDGFIHAFIHENDAVNAQVAGAMNPVPGSPARVKGTSVAGLSLDAGDEITHFIATRYPPPDPGDQGGQMSFEVHCPDGMVGMETGWSNTAFLLSDVSMKGTWASVAVGDGNLARWSAQLMTEWSATLAKESTLFIAKEPVVGRATLNSPSSEFTCGPSVDRSALAGRALCMYEFDGGETSLEVTQATTGRVQLVGADARDRWMGLIAQMEYHTWPNAP